VNILGSHIQGFMTHPQHLAQLCIGLRLAEPRVAEHHRRAHAREGRNGAPASPRRPHRVWPEAPIAGPADAKPHIAVQCAADRVRCAPPQQDLTAATTPPQATSPLRRSGKAGGQVGGEMAK